MVSGVPPWREDKLTTTKAEVELRKEYDKECAKRRPPGMPAMMEPPPQHPPFTAEQQLKIQNVRQDAAPAKAKPGQPKPPSQPPPGNLLNDFKQEGTAQTSAEAATGLDKKISVDPSYWQTLIAAGKPPAPEPGPSQEQLDAFANRRKERYPKVSREELRELPRRFREFFLVS